MENYREWLINKGFGSNTAADYNKFIEKKFKLYLHTLLLSIEEFEHEQLMQYIRHRKAEGVGAKTINLELKKISYYLDFKGLPNVAEPIRLKGVQRRIPHDLFTEKQLDNIYQKFPESKNHWTHENTLKTYHLILGLRIYQGLQEQELAKLEINHLQLDKGKIYVPATKRTNKRILDLKPFQILPLHEYLLTERKSLNDEIEGGYLFHKKRLIRGMSRIKKMINRSRLKCGTSYEPRLNNMAQIRASVITNWLQHYNLREVQYMAGHKYVSSTERYRTDNLEDLQKELEKYHPLK
ncbi:MAG TPA: tyrosine-type recombinase/integrase [Bacteroidales bacterium]|nr:tyrosine-type recombinase/integrase [Bacteroidales bacterium]